MKKKNLITLLSIVLGIVILGGVGVFLISNNVDGDDQLEEVSESNIEVVQPVGDGLTDQLGSIEEVQEDVEEKPKLKSEYLGSYSIDDTGYGTRVNVEVDEANGVRNITSNALPNHDTGEFPNSGNPNAIAEQNKSWSYPLNPVFVGTATEVNEPGVAVNGVKFEPGTAERVTCESGETYRIEAIQDVTDLGLDFNNAHVQPNGEYHYHGVSNMLVGAFESDNDLVHIGFAADGHMIYYSKSGAYEAGYSIGTDARSGVNCTYTSGGPNGRTINFGSTKDGSLDVDWAFAQKEGGLDECNGIKIGDQYVYIITQGYPYIPRCLKGEFTEAARTPGGGGGIPPRR